VIYNVLRWVLQQGAEEGELRDYPTEGKGSVGVKLTVRREMEARRREDGRPTQTQGRGEKARGALTWPAKEKNGKGRKRGCGGDGAAF
jgi:hypothetical protein